MPDYITETQHQQDDLVLLTLKNRQIQARSKVKFNKIQIPTSELGIVEIWTSVERDTKLPSCTEKVALIK